MRFHFVLLLFVDEREKMKEEREESRKITFFRDSFFKKTSFSFSTTLTMENRKEIIKMDFVE